MHYIIQPVSAAKIRTFFYLTNIFLFFLFFYDFFAFLGWSASHSLVLLSRFFAAPSSPYERRSTLESVTIGKNR